MLVLVCASILAVIELCVIVPILLGYYDTLGVVGGACSGFARFIFLVLIRPLQMAMTAVRRRLPHRVLGVFGQPAGWVVATGAGPSRPVKEPAVGGRGDALELLLGNAIDFRGQRGPLRCEHMV